METLRVIKPYLIRTRWCSEVWPEQILQGGWQAEAACQLSTFNGFYADDVPGIYTIRVARLWPITTLSVASGEIEIVYYRSMLRQVVHNDGIEIWPVLIVSPHENPSRLPGWRAAYCG